jgi:hypothetical protein
VPKSPTGTELFKIARVSHSPLRLIRHGSKCKVQKERGEVKNNDHNLLLRPRSRVFWERMSLECHTE